ncbi:MAG TPA: leucine-rich repeat domain-containing protein [Polyangiaceae bacterium]
MGSVFEICNGYENSVLAHAIAEELGTSDDTSFSSAELESVTQIAVDGLGSFDGFQCLPNLQRLAVGASTAVDLGPLAGLSRLADITIGRSAAPDFDTLTHGTRALASSLVRLSVVQCEAEDLTGLGALTALRILDLSENRTADLSELGALTKLEELDLHGNRVVDLAALASLQALRTLNLDANQVESLEGLTGLGALSLLRVTANRLTSIGSVDLPGLIVLEAGMNAVEMMGNVSGMPTLETLNLRENQLRDIAGIESLTKLVTLTLSDNALSDLAPLAGLGTLETLDLSNSGVEALQPLEDLAHVVDLDLRNSLVSDLSPLFGWASAPTSPCRKLAVSEALLDETSTQRVVPALCAGPWQVQGDTGFLCEKSSCNPI